MSKHSSVNTGGVHIVNNWLSGNHTARDAVTVSSNDTGKAGRQSDEGSLYLGIGTAGDSNNTNGSASTAPVWARLGNIGGAEYLVQTTDATVTTVARIALTDLQTYCLKVHVGCLEDGGSGDRAFYEIVGVFYRDGGGATQQGTTTTTVSIESSAGLNVAFTPTGNNVDVEVTGIAATTLNWRCYVDALILQ